MSTDRFVYHQAAVRTALGETVDGKILQVGTNEDPARLKAIDPARVINSDLFEHDTVLDRPNLVDITFDVARDKWPFKKRTLALVVMGDILEHLTPIEIHKALKEARRVSRRLCVTVPMDTRPENTNQRADLYPRGAVHRTVVNEDMLRGALAAAGWKITDWRSLGPGIWWADYFFVTAE